MNQAVYNKTINLLKAKQIRVTPQREAIISYMIDSTAHPTAEMIYAKLSPQFPHMSVATVYNNLRLLVDLNAICTNCGKIFDFTYPGVTDVEAVAAKKTGFKVSGHHLEVYGICPECQIKLGMK